MPIRRWSLPVLAAAILAGAGFYVEGSSAESPRLVPPPAIDEPLASQPGKATAVLAGGCFWGVQGVFQHVKGVTNAVSGYAGGDGATAQYHTVSTGRTGHAESVRITYDPSRISYGELLRIYFSVAHDPTQLDRQGPDRGPQYRSAIFPQDAEQARIAKAYIAELDAAKVFADPVVTKIEIGRRFFPAEGYHQDYLTLHPDEPYIAYVDKPKIVALKATFPEAYQETPVLVSSAGVGE